MMAEEDKTDPNRYYLRPGCTEPELRPEIVEGEAAAAAKPAKAAKKARASKAKPIAKKK